MTMSAKHGATITVASENGTGDRPGRVGPIVASHAAVTALPHRSSFAKDCVATLAARRMSDAGRRHHAGLARALALFTASSLLACGSGASDTGQPIDSAPADSRFDDATLDGSDSSGDSSSDTPTDSSLDTGAETNGDGSSDGGSGSCKSDGGTIACAAGKECVYGDPLPKCDAPSGGEPCGAITCRKGGGAGPLCKCENAATSTCQCLVVGL